MFEKIQNLDYRWKSSIPYEIEHCAVQEVPINRMTFIFFLQLTLASTPEAAYY